MYWVAICNKEEYPSAHGAPLEKHQGSGAQSVLTLEHDVHTVEVELGPTISELH